MSNLILGVTPTKRLTHRLYIGLETNWTLKENNQIAKATPPKMVSIDICIALLKYINFIKN